MEEEKLDIPVEQPEVSKQVWMKELREWLVQMAVTIVVVVLLNVFVFHLVVVSGSSMYPTLLDKDLLLIWMLGYEPEAGDIVVCDAAEDGILSGKQVVKRCIATEGQTVVVDYGNNTVTVDGVRLRENYINFDDDDPLASSGNENTIYLVPEGCVFVMGDNRNHSTDSRDGAVDYVPLENVMGKMVLRIPLGQWFD